MCSMLVVYGSCVVAAFALRCCDVAMAGTRHLRLLHRMGEVARRHTVYGRPGGMYLPGLRFDRPDGSGKAVVAESELEVTGSGTRML